VQSQWILDRIRERGYEPVMPVVIPNAANPRIFYPGPRAPLSTGHKVRLISTSWSQNPNKGAAFYRSLESRLDWSRFEYTFVGNSAVPFEKIRHLPPLPSEALAEMLRRHDVFVSASRKEACSNAVVEALSCGLPVLYISDGSHAELVRSGGLPFLAEDDFLARLDELVTDYDRFRSQASAPRMSDVARRYLAAAGFDPGDRPDV
jgi:glycosyltransferase involved in cell wall biosynthesis